MEMLSSLRDNFNYFFSWSNKKEKKKKIDYLDASNYLNQIKPPTLEKPQKMYKRFKVFNFI
jgi:hypothetical protein